MHVIGMEIARLSANKSLCLGGARERVTACCWRLEQFYSHTPSYGYATGKKPFQEPHPSALQVAEFGPWGPKNFGPPFHHAPWQYPQAQHPYFKIASYWPGILCGQWDPVLYWLRRRPLCLLALCRRLQISSGVATCTRLIGLFD